MVIDFTNNTSRIPMLQSQQPQAFLRRRGLAGLGQDAPPTNATASGMSWSEIGTGLNMELLYLINLDRSMQGEKPLDAKATAPGVNVGLTPETQNAALLAVAGLLGVFLLARRR
jgi:hypothetical protein